MSQTIPQLGKIIDVDRDKYSCTGLLLEDMKKTDWNKIDMTEWIGLMTGSGIVPTHANSITSESMTGSGQLLNTHGRETTQERISGRIPNSEMTDRQQEIYNVIVGLNVDCSLSNPPPVCTYRSKGP